MPRTKNELHSPYYMGAMAKYCDLAIGGHPSARPSGEEQSAWFAKHLRKKGEMMADSEVPGVESLKKVYCKMRRSPWNCSFDESTLNKVCGMIGKDVDFADFSTYEGFKKWMGEPPKGDENWLAIIARERIQQLFEETEKQKLLLRNAENTARSLTFDIEKIEQYFAVNNLSLAEANKHAKLQRKQLEELEKLADFAIQEIATVSFVKSFNTVFVYDCNKILTVSLTSKLWPVAWKIDQYLTGVAKHSTEMLRHMLDLKCNLMKAAWATGKTEITKQLNNELLELIDENKQRNTLEMTPLFPYYFSYYSYSCCINPEKTAEFCRFASQVQCPPKEQQTYIWKSLKCTACVNMRQGNYEEAENTLARMRSECNQVFDDHASPKPMLAYYYYLLGSTHYYQGRQFYTKALQNLRQALDHWSKTELDISVEAGHAYFLLSEIEREAGHLAESISLSEKANAIFQQTAKTNACSFNYHETKRNIEQSIYKNRR